VPPPHKMVVKMEYPFWKDDWGEFKAVVTENGLIMIYRDDIQLLLVVTTSKGKDIKVFYPEHVQP